MSTNILLVYITCKDTQEAMRIGTSLMEKRLCACTNIFPNMQSSFFWPPKSGLIENANEVVLIAKTVENKYEELESEVIKTHSYDVPCIVALPTAHTNKGYRDWLISELSES